jgi:gliding motility-associated protein GldC
MSKDVKKTFEIKLQVGLDEDNMPIEMKWEAENNPNANGLQECKGMLLSVFDNETLDTLRIDLWTKEMQVVEMDRFMFQTLKSLADTYHRATRNNKLASHMQQFATYFGEETEIIPKKNG